MCSGSGRLYPLGVLGTFLKLAGSEGGGFVVGVPKYRLE